jgi:hypothetical protein
MVDRAGVVADVGVFRKVPPAMNSGDRIRKPLPTNREAGTRTGHQQRSLMRLARVGTRVEVPGLTAGWPRGRPAPVSGMDSGGYAKDSPDATKIRDQIFRRIVIGAERRAPA